MENINLWWSIVSIIIALGLFIWNIWQLSANKKEKEIHKSQVKVWQQHASGLMLGLKTLVSGQFSSVKDMQEAAKISQGNASSLYISLNEERLFSEEEVKQRQLKIEHGFKTTNVEK